MSLTAIKFRNIFAALRDQGPLKRFIRNLRNGTILGLFHKRSHQTLAGKDKIMYGSKESAIKAANAMMRKQPGVRFSNYKCLYCDGFHIGKSGR